MTYFDARADRLSRFDNHMRMRMLRMRMHIHTCMLLCTCTSTCVMWHVACDMCKRHYLQSSVLTVISVAVKFGQWKAKRKLYKGSGSFSRVSRRTVTVRTKRSRRGPCRARWYVYSSPYRCKPYSRTRFVRLPDSYRTAMGALALN